MSGGLLDHPAIRLSESEQREPMVDLAAQWYENSLSESERKAIVRNVAGAMEYGLTRSWTCLSECVRMVIRREYRRITSKS
jgi:hypothetical protein